MYLYATVSLEHGLVYTVLAVNKNNLTNDILLFITYNLKISPCITTLKSVIIAIKRPVANLLQIETCVLLSSVQSER